MSAKLKLNNLEGGSLMRAIAYVRVSSEEQVQGTSLDSQVQSCIDYANSQGIELRHEDIYREEGFTATKLVRPKLSEMIKFSNRNKGKIQYCLIWKVSRLARKSEHYHVIKARLANNGIKVISTTEPISDDPMGNMMESILAAW
ncbi:MAG: recombinase family protein, partial [Candidatus Saccharibacteria bacterium]|nr:recombinase family protein [Candidatus Saccharibacteria bacterium]